MSTKANRSVYSLLNAFSAVTLTLLNGLLGIVVTRLILQYYGSDFNGLNSTANQVVHVLMIVEGGFTTASNVALFRPIVNKEYNLINGILAATRKKFRVIGSLFFAFGTLVAVGYSFLANSGLPTDFIFSVIMMTMIPPAINLFFATTYRVLLQAQQKEFVISLITALTISLGHICNIIMISSGGSMFFVRVITMTFAIANSFLIIFYVRKKNSFLNLSVAPRKDMIKGTGDVMVQRITSVIYDSSPIIFLSISSSGGTILASVYAVYNNVFIIIKSFIRGIIDAPRLSLGQLLSKNKREDVWCVFSQYEYVAFLATFVLLSTACALILPFVKLYTEGINDAEYINPLIAVLMIVISSLEMLHMPSSHLLNMAGKFKICKRIQIITCVTLLLTMALGGSFGGIYGMLFSLLITTLLLCGLEMGYVHIKFFEKKLLSLLRLFFPLAIICIATCFFELKFSPHVNNYFLFVVYGCFFLIINSLIAFLSGLLFNRQEILSLLNRAKRILVKSK